MRLRPSNKWLYSLHEGCKETQIQDDLIVIWFLVMVVNLTLILAAANKERICGSGWTDLQ